VLGWETEEASSWCSENSGIIMKKSLSIGMACLLAASTRGELEESFRSPPESARPYTFYHFMNGNISRPGIKKDLEAFAANGIGGLSLFDINWHTPHGGVYFDSKEYHSAVEYMLSEASRLGLDVSIKNHSGWSSTGAAWVTPEQSMKKLVWSEKQIKAGENGVQLEQPKALHDFYRDIAVLAFPTPNDADYRLAHWFEKALDGHLAKERTGEKKMSDRNFPPSFEKAPVDAVISIDDVVNLSRKMDESGKLNWSPKSGEWTVVRFGCTTTGEGNRPASDGAKGLEIDKMSRAVADVYWEKFLDKIVAYGKGHKAFSTFLIDSYEVGHQNWTDGFDKEFQKRAGYDLIPHLVCVTGRILESTETSERVLWDLRRTAADLVYENYFLYFTEKCHQNGLKMELESYGWGPFEASRVAQIADIPVTEFWQNKAHDPWADSLGFQWTAQMMSSAAHLTGRNVVGAEAYTRMKGDWKMHPYVMKIRGDRAFARGINRFIFHSASHNPLRDEVKPGMTMGQFGFQGARNNTWFYDSKVWKEYIARCQSVFQQGDYVSDFLYLYGDERGFNCFYKEKELSEPWLPGHKFNVADIGTLDRLFVDENGKVRVTYEGKTLPNIYEMLVMKRTVLMTPDTAQKLGVLAEKGATVYCDRPVRTPRLKDFEKNDAALNALLKKYWDSGKIRPLSELDDGIKAIMPDCEMADKMQYAHHKIGDADFYFISNQTYDSREEKVTFRMVGKWPELWNPETGDMRAAPNWRITEDGRTQVDLELDPADSVFVVFRKPTDQTEKVSPKMEYAAVGKITGDWTVTFDPAFGPREPQAFAELVAWNEHSNEDVKYFSGTASYRKTIKVSDPDAELYLDLGDVQIMARVLVNGKDLGVLWKPPFRVNLSGALRKGKNELDIRVTNLWVNRLIGDAALPETGKRSKWKNEAYERFPDWVLNGTPIPDGHRRTFAPWNHYDKGGKLMPSGLQGPIRLMKHVELP